MSGFKSVSAESLMVLDEPEKKKLPSNRLDTTLPEGVEKRTIRLRFLPPHHKSGIDEVVAITHDHYIYRGSRNNFFGHCRKMYNEECPVCKVSEQKWAVWRSTHNQTEKKLKAKEAGTYTPDKVYNVNVLVVSDSVEPANNGKVFVYKFKKQIYGILHKALAGDTDLGIPKKEVFDIQRGAIFNLVCSRKGDYVTYESSIFAEGGYDLTPQLDNIVEQLHDLSSILVEKETLASMTARFNEFHQVNKTDALNELANQATQSATYTEVSDSFDDDIFSN